MLEEKLDQARRQKKLRYRNTFISLFVLAVFCGLLIIGLSSLDFTNRTQQVAIDNEVVLPAEENTDAIRDEFKKNLAQYENEIEPRLAAYSIEQMNKTAFQEMQEMKQSSLLHFSSGDYRHAIEQLGALREYAKKILADAENDFNESFHKAVSFFDKDLYDEALFHINQALVIAPESTEAIALKLQIEQLPALLPLLDQARVARLENNLQKEYDSLQQILQIVPERLEEDQRLKAVAEALTRQQFEKHIAAGFAAVKAGKAASAREHHQKAKSITAKREELAVLMNEIVSLEKNTRVQNALIQADASIRRDDWQRAKVAFASVLKETPDNPTAAAGMKKADLVLQLQENLRHFLDDPYRLSDKKVHRSAKNILHTARESSRYSYSIKKQADQLEDLLKKINRKIPVLITSDAKTHVIVRGVGKVGTVTQKEIQLFPGRYAFEGSRDGYKSKLLHVLIPFDQDNFSLFITCDERI